ncbi:MAG: tannase/feruloyl esterase family alpha/beta hydrolase [Sphingomonadales bacterium]|nr:tannase/feruloyl esterase family alpha/beta hydrolase [Sphingomonadales bacterium]
MRPVGARRGALAVGGAALAAVPAQAATCDAAARLHVPDVHVARLTEVGGDRPLTGIPGIPPLAERFCRVEGTIGGESGFELWLPEKARWNHRLLTGGVGGQAGTFAYRELARAVARGYAGASTDGGHKASEAHWLLHRPDRAANYVWRAHHLLAVKARAMLRGVYGTGPLHAFFVGCSGGGRQALTEVQRFPGDYDGVIAGAPGVNTPEMSARRMWEMQRHSQWGAMMPASAWQLAYRAAIAACDGRDGVRDGVVDDPRACRFAPGSLLCRPGQAGECLDSAQVAAVRRLAAPLHDENGRRLDDGLLPTVRVSPAPLPEPFTPGPSYLATVLFADGVHGDPGWDARNFSLARDLPAIDRVMDLHADNPAIEPFLRRGGRLIVYQGWDDPLVSAPSTLAYWRALSARFGAGLARSARLFMVPGMEHCRGGPGAELFGGAGGDAPQADPQHDLLSALEQWVLRGRAPSRIVASRVEAGRIVRTRPLCAWPLRAVWDGRGPADTASSFTCRKD